MLLLYIFVALLGLCVGSFLNVLISRLPQKRKITGRSVCPHCKKKLSFFDLIPLFSYIFLRGRCRYCKKKISLQYPLIEILTSFFFVLVVFLLRQMSFGDFRIFVFNVVFWLFFVSVLIIIFTTDFKYYIVPDKVIYPAIFIALFYQIGNAIFLKSKTYIINPLLAGFGAALFFLCLVLITKGKGMGLGDVKIALFMGLVLSFPNIIVALLIAFFGGSIIGLIMVFLKKKTLKSEIPFGCFLAPSTFIAFFWGMKLLNLYKNFFLR